MIPADLTPETAANDAQDEDAFEFVVLLAKLGAAGAETFERDVELAEAA